VAPETYSAGYQRLRQCCNPAMPNLVNREHF
jgi:hypothetical protein